MRRPLSTFVPASALAWSTAVLVVMLLGAMSTTDPVADAQIGPMLTIQPDGSASASRPPGTLVHLAVSELPAAGYFLIYGYEGAACGTAAPVFYGERFADQTGKGAEVRPVGDVGTVLSYQVVDDASGATSNCITVTAAEPVLLVQPEGSQAATRGTGESADLTVAGLVPELDHTLRQYAAADCGSVVPTERVVATDSTGNGTAAVGPFVAGAVYSYQVVQDTGRSTTFSNCATITAVVPSTPSLVIEPEHALAVSRFAGEYTDLAVAGLTADGGYTLQSFSSVDCTNKNESTAGTADADGTASATVGPVPGNVPMAYQVTDNVSGVSSNCVTVTFAPPELTILPDGTTSEIRSPGTDVELAIRGITPTGEYWLEQSVDGCSRSSGTATTLTADADGTDTTTVGPIRNRETRYYRLYDRTTRAYSNCVTISAAEPDIVILPEGTTTAERFPVDTAELYITNLTPGGTYRLYKTFGDVCFDKNDLIATGTADAFGTATVTVGPSLLQTLSYDVFDVSKNEGSNCVTITVAPPTVLIQPEGTTTATRHPQDTAILAIAGLQPNGRYVLEFLQPRVGGGCGFAGYELTGNADAAGTAVVTVGPWSAVAQDHSYRVVDRETRLSGNCAAITVDPNAPVPTPTATASPTGTVTPEPTGTATAEPTGTVTPEPTGTATAEPTGTVTPEPTETVTPDPTGTVTPQATLTPEPAGGAVAGTGNGAGGGGLDARPIIVATASPEPTPHGGSSIRLGTGAALGIGAAPNGDTAQTADPLTAATPAANEANGARTANGTTSAGSDVESLAFTGGGSARLPMIGLAMLVSGLGMVAVSRRRPCGRTSERLCR